MDEIRSNWLRSSLAQIKELRAAGVPVLGYTWFPTFTMIDWEYRWKRRPLEKYYLELGLYKYNAAEGSNPRWHPTLGSRRVQELHGQPRGKHRPSGYRLVLVTCISKAPPALRRGF